MIIPFSVPEALRLILDAEEEIVQADISNSLILTNTSLYLLDSETITIIAIHKRTKDSLIKYGQNIQFKRVDDLIIIQSEKDFLLIYSVVKIHNVNRNELLTVYTPNSELLQNGLVQQDDLGYSFFTKDAIEEPILKEQLRFKLFLKVINGIIDFICLSKVEIMLITKQNVSILDLSSDKNTAIEFDGIEDKIVKIVHSNGFFLIFTDQNEAKLVELKNKEFKEVENFKFKNVTDGVINTDYNLIILKQGNRLVYHNFVINTELKAVISEDEVKSLQWSHDNQTLIILYKIGYWSLHSIFGSTFFNSKNHSEYNADIWLSKINSISIDDYNSKILLLTKSEIFKLDLLSSQLSLSNGTINHNQNRPILINGAELHVYSGYEMININSNVKTINWNMIKIPYEQFHQIKSPKLSQISISTDSKFIALSNGHGLLLYSTIDNDWSFYINDYNHDMNIQNITWFDKLNLLIVINKTALSSELIIFDFKRFDKSVNFDSNYIVFKYEFDIKDDEVCFINLVHDDLLVLTKKNKLFYFKFELLLKGFKIDLIKVLSLEKLFKATDIIQNIIKVKNNDIHNFEFLVQLNGELIYLKQLEDKAFEKNLLFDKVEYIHKINNNEYYLFNGENVLLIKDFNNLISSNQPETSILSIPTDNLYPILLILDKGLIVTLENELINKKQIQLNNITTKNSIFLHDLIKFELLSQDHDTVFKKYQKYKNFQYSLELLLYKTIINNEDISNISKLIKIDPLIELNIISKCLRKIEVYYWKDLFKQLDITPDILLDRSIELKQFKILGILIIIFLNYDHNDNDIDKYNLKKDESKLINFLKLIYENSSNDDELWETALEMLRFFKILDPTGELLKKSIETLEQK